MKKAFVIGKIFLIACLVVTGSCVNAPSAPTGNPPPVLENLAADKAAADQAFEKGTFQEAFTAYEKVYKGTNDAGQRAQSFYRMAESLTHLFRFGEAAQLLFDTPLPDDPAARARVLLLKAALAKTFLDQYGYILNQDTMAGTAGAGKVFSLTREQIQAEIDKSYDELWKLKDTLKAMSLKDEGYYFLIDKVDGGEFPTVFDFFLQRWTDAMTAGKSMTEAELKFLLGDQSIKFDALPPGAKAADLMAQAVAFMADKYPESAEYWRVKAFTLALKLGWPALDAAASEAYHAQIVAKLTELMDKLTRPGPRALAGYTAAEQENARGKYVEAVALCDKITGEFDGTRGAKNAVALRLQITNPYLSMSADTMSAQQQKKITIGTRNLESVYFRAFRLKPDVLAGIEKNPAALYSLAYGYNDNALGKRVTASRPDYEWQAATEDPGKHEYLSRVIAPPVLPEGIYLLLACNDATFAPGRTLLTSTLLNVTSLMLVSTPGVSLKTRAAYYALLDNRGPARVTDNAFRYYAFDIVTGKPVVKANLFVGWRNDYLFNEQRQAALATGATGSALLETSVTVAPGEYNQIRSLPLAKKGNSYAYLQNETYLSFYPGDALEFFIDTDRPIYRPGDKLKARVAGVRRTADGFRALTKDYTVNLRANDPNGNAIFEKAVGLNDFGSADVEFDIPKGKLLGSYSLAAGAARGIFKGEASVSFQVEEYKRPEFEIVFDPIDKPLRFGRPAELSGTVKYYFGGAAANADVAYTVKRSLYVPWYYRSWFFGGYSANQIESASGNLKTDDSGKFKIVFTPKSEDAALPDWLRGGLAPEIAQYDVSVDARDSGGRTITGATTCKVGKTDAYFVIEPDKGFYFEKDVSSFALSRLSVNDRPLAGAASYEVHLLKNPPLRTWLEMGYSYYKSGVLSTGLPGPDYQLKDAVNQSLVAQGKTSFGTDGKSRLNLLALAPGAYRLTLKGKDEAGTELVQHKTFVVVNNAGADVPINFTAVTAIEKSEYKVGDKARLLIGSRFTAGAYAAEVWAGQYFVKTIFIDNAKPVQVLEVPVTPEMKGGFTVRWFGIKDLETYSGEESAEVPWSEKTMSLALTPFKGTLAPGEKATWGVKALDAGGKPVASEVLVLMYDRSLEYYNKTSASDFASLYLPNPSPTNASTSGFLPYAQSQYLNAGPLYDRLYNDTRIQPAILPGFRTDRTSVYYGYRGGAEKGGMMFDAMPAPAPAMAESEDRPSAQTATGGVKTAKEADRRDSDGNQPPMPAVQARQAFADTAFFLPHVVTDKNGTGRFSFTAPEQLTGWKIKAIAFTPDVQWGSLEAEAVTRKDLMVRLDLPRFFREKDKGTVTAVVHNESDQTLTGRVWIDILDSDVSVLAALKLTNASQAFTVKAHGQVTFDWAVSIPAGLAAYKVRAAATAGTLSDAEERPLPILPSRQRLIESAFAVIRGNETKSIAIPVGLDPTRINESVTLSLDPQLTLSLMNTIPFLIDYPYSCVEQSLNRYVPLAVMNELYGKYPEVRKAVAKIPKRTTVTPPWNDKDPLRALQIDETPWGWEAKGRPSFYPVIDLLDPAIVTAQKETAFAELKAAQLSSGAFPWWPGGREDLYMTLYALAGLAEAHRYGVALDTDMVNRALRYVNNTIPQNFKPEDYQLALIAYASYVVTSFPTTEFSEAAASAQLVKGWLDFLYGHRAALTPFGKGYLAYVYFRLNDKTKAEEILAMAMDGAREDPIAGVYWTPEAYSWVWYSDTVEKHAFFLRTLLDWKPDDKRIDGLARWLLWNRTGNVWKSTKASAAALYSLLEYLAKGGALLSDERYTIDWGASKEKVQVKGDEWRDQPLRFERPEAAVGAAGLTTTIQKEGQGTSFASLTWIYSTDQLPQASAAGMLNLERRFFVRTKDALGAYSLREIKSGDEVAVGDQIEVRVTVTAKSQFEYLHLRDPKAAGFEAETLLSGWKYDPLWYYEEPRDSSTNFFFDWIPHGEYVLSYRLRPTKPGEYRIGATTLQSMYAPELNAHAAGFVIRVKK